MPKNLSSINIRLQKPVCQKAEEGVVRISKHIDGEYVAKVFKYYRGLQNTYRTAIVPLKLVSGKKIYKLHKDAFDAFANRANKHKFDIDAYMKYCVIHRGINESCIESCLNSTTLLVEFSNYLKKKRKLAKIYNAFMNTVKNIVDECIKKQTYTTKDFLRELISTNMIGPYVLAGKLSIYYLAAIPSFNKVIKHLDYFSKLELKLLDEHFEIYHSEVNEAFLDKKHKMVNPIELTDLSILKALKKI